MWRNVGVKDRFRSETSTQVILRCNVTKYDYIQMLNKVEGDDDETILTNLKWCLGQLKLKTVQFPHSARRTRSKSKVNPVNKYKSQEHNLMQESQRYRIWNAIISSANAGVKILGKHLPSIPIHWTATQWLILLRKSEWRNTNSRILHAAHLLCFWFHQLCCLGPESRCQFGISLLWY